MPPQPATKQIPAADPVLVAIADLTREVRGTRADIGLVANDVGIMKDRMSVAESRITGLEDARKNNSMRAQQSSQMDMDHEAKIAAEIVARTELAEKADALAKEVAELKDTNALQLAILGRLDKFAANPNIKIILAVLATALMSWAASKGLK